MENPIYIYISFFFKKKTIFKINFQVYKALLEKTKSTLGAKVESNRFCVSVNFRCVDEKVKIKPIYLLKCVFISLLIILGKTCTKKIHKMREFIEMECTEEQCGNKL
ncbi:hypothetical protein HHK36_029263 [Tetracentron sinense]|uniref:Uncharacterized protein n=1 Tax=Tetracentron sinense TaxID=13715 RepID=A0A834YEN2_TETSI|nr:hypothetical protein HHK36_029263 [Tetracentron sinense]